MSNGGKVTLSVVTADIGGFVGRVSSHPDVLDTAKERLHNAKEKGLIKDFHVLRCGDGLGLIIYHALGERSPVLHELSWNAFFACMDAASELRLHAPERDAHGGCDDKGTPFGGGLKGHCPVIAEMEFTLRESEPVVIFMVNKTLTGPFNLPLYKIFADPFNTAGLILDALMLPGFSFKVADPAQGGNSPRVITLSTPNETYPLLALIGSTSRYVVQAVYRNSDDEICAVISSEKLKPAGDSAAGGITPLGRGEPAAIIRCQTGFPAVGEVMEGFAHPHLVAGWMRGAYNGPLLPVPFYEANPARFDGPPRAIAAGFQLTEDRLIGPHDMFDDPSFDESRRTANVVADYIRRQGPFEPHRLPEDELGATALPFVLEKIKNRFKKV
ncbi:MAG: fructose 1,6-bisphosphatase [Deltaproteobacteria bacterium]|nr:fructose 1,6-bisphosphatase [Deltaproteobacteria bacterium]